MPATIGSLSFVALRSVPPKLREASVALHVRAGTAGAGGRVQPATGKEFEIEVLDVIADSSRLSRQYDYKALIGTKVNFIHNSLNYGSTLSTNFIVLGVEVVESKTTIRAVGRDAAGSSIDIAPAGWIVSRWRMVAVPA